MRLESVLLRHYRVHRELRVDFDPARTLIGGPNEAGKSTLVEAIHRALFLRSRVTGEVQKSMVSRTAGGAPEVELTFAAGGRRWRVGKRFSGTTGTTNLQEIGGSAWAQEEAEEKLAGLLGVPVMGGGRGAADRLREQWAHLWIWQGCAGEDPTAAVNSQCHDLLARLQREGGAAAVQSAADQRIAQTIAERHSALFKENGEPRANTAYGQAIAAEAQARGELEAARAALARVEQAVDEFFAAESAAQAATAALAALRQEQAVLQEKLTRLAALQNDARLQEPAAALAAENHRQVWEADRAIRSLREQREHLAAALAAPEREMAGLADSVAEWRARDEAAEQRLERASAAVRVAREQAEWAAAEVRRIEKAEACAPLAARARQVRTAQEELAALRAELARLPAISAAKLKSLEKLAHERAAAVAARDAMAAGLEVQRTDQPVTVGGRALAGGATELLTDETIVEIGDAIRLRIRPGGGDSLALARRRIRELEEEIARVLGALALGSIEAAAFAHDQREQIEKRIAAGEIRLEALGASALEQELNAAEQARLGAEADAGRRRAALGAGAAPSTLGEAQQREAELQATHAAAAQAETAAAAERKLAAQGARSAAQRLEEQQRALRAKKDELQKIQAQLDLRLGTEGDDTARTHRLIELEAEKDRAAAVLAATRRALAELQPELLERDRERLDRALAQQTAARQAALERGATLTGELRRDGTSDPHGEAARAEERWKAAAQARAREQRSAEAVALLHDLFTAEQRALAAQFTRPLASRVTRYLECLFGPGTRAEVTLEGRAFSGLRLVRSTGAGQAFDFEHLSGGTREQLAAAMRLAVAEVLAEAHDGSLPLVFDDAFACADPERVRTLQRMLDVAAERGLQIIVLSCNPADYAALGARPVLLPAPSA